MLNALLAPSMHLRDCRAGWSVKDHDIFVMVGDAYNRNRTQNSHLLFVDNLKKLLPHKSRREIVSREKSEFKF